MSQSDDFPGGLHFDEVRSTGTRYYPVGDVVERAPKRVSPWWHVAGFLLGVSAAAAAVFVTAFALDLLALGARVEGLLAMGVVGLLVGLVSVGKLSPAAPLTIGLAALTGSVLYELGTFPFFPVLRTLFESGIPVVVGVLLLLLAWRRA